MSIDYLEREWFEYLRNMLQCKIRHSDGVVKRDSDVK